MRLVVSFILFFSALCLNGAIVQINGKWSDSKHAPTMAVAEHFDLGCRLLEEKNYKEALNNFLVITIHFSESRFYSDALYYSGICYYNTNDLDLANKQFTRYLDIGSQLNHFEKIFEYKFLIAEGFSKGAKKHLFGVGKLPKWMPAKREALEIYDEVIATMGSSEIGIKALYAKGQLQLALKEYKESTETLNTLLRRFPKHRLASESFLLISDVYLEQCINEPQNPDFISHALVNLQHFRKSFPADQRILQVEKNLLTMHETHAASLFEAGKFYEKKKKPKAATIYYEEASKRYPETVAGKKSSQKLAQLQKK